MPYIPCTDTELRQIAMNFVEGKCERLSDDNAMYFIPFSLMSKEQLQQLQDDNITLIFEYKDKQMSRGFYSSFRILNAEDHKKVFNYYEEFKTQHEKNLVSNTV